RAGLGQATEALDDRRGLLLVEVDPGEHGALDLAVRTTHSLAVLAQDGELVAHELGRAAVEVARVRVLGHQPKGLPLSAAAHQDRHAWPADRLRRVDEVRRRDATAVEALVRAAAAGPH